MSIFIRKLRPSLSGLLRSKPAVPTPVAPPPTARRYYHAPCTRRSHDALQSSGRGVLFRPNPVLGRRPPPSQLAIPRYYSYRRKRSSADEAARTVMAVVMLVGGVVITIRDGTIETVPYTNRHHLVVISFEEERNLGEAQFASLKKELGKKVLPTSHSDTIRVTGISTKIISAARRGLASDDNDKLLDEAIWSSNAAQKKKKKPRKVWGAQPMTKHLDELKWEVIVVDDKPVNAMCLPGGKIVVYTGLLHHFNTDAEIATVLGHEIAHVIARHIAETFTKNMWTAILRALMTIDTDDSKMVNDLTEYVLTLPFSRKMEIEADHIGILLLAAAGFDPRIAPGFYEKLGKISGNTSVLEQYKNTHPSSEKRSRLLAEPKVMEKAMALYREARARTEETE
ncbi:mitochondrial metalloendopeptidase OMA1-like [Aegilops tauschii subsp. strangulata]|nr:mitochondrial metalloendopeptidase OMA1-like [Aegilops tauschii subsp. strangulata]